jgi:hypothetical protein
LLSHSAVAYEDFRPVYQELIFNEETSNTQTVFVPILNDVCLEEYGEFFSVVATSDTDCVEIVNGEVTIIIDDDDKAKITLYESFYKISEDVGSVDICVQLKTDIKRDVEFQLSVIDATARDGSDFDSPADLTGTFTVGGDDHICFTFNISDDDCVEEKEYFLVELSSSDGYVDVHTSIATVHIKDNDYALFGLQQEVYYVEENAGFVRVCVELFDGCLQRDVYIEIKKLDATAMNEADFVGGKYQLHFENGSVSGAIDCIDIEIIDDNIKEGNESFLVVLSPGGDEAVHLVNHYADVYIIDDDCMLVLSGFSQHPMSDL